MLKIVHFFQWGAEPAEDISGGSKGQIIRHLKGSDEISDDEARAVLRAVATHMYGPELERWKFLPEALPGEFGEGSRVNDRDVGTARPAKFVAYEIGQDKDGKLEIGNYLAIRFYA